MLTQPINLQRIKYRNEHIISITEKNSGNLIMTATRVNMTTQEAIEEALRLIIDNEETSKEETSNTEKSLKENGWQTKKLDNGKIGTINIRTIFRKA